MAIMVLIMKFVTCSLVAIPLGPGMHFAHEDLMELSL
jgi:hypothetical protein